MRFVFDCPFISLSSRTSEGLACTFIDNSTDFFSILNISITRKSFLLKCLAQVCMNVTEVSEGSPIGLVR